MSLEIRPYEGIGSLRFGMPVDVVRSVLGGRFKSFKKTSDSEMLTDDFIDAGLHVYYRCPGQCEAIEMFSPSEPTLLGRTLLGLPFLQVYEWIKQIDPAVETDDAGLTSYKFGVGLYCSGASKSPLEPVESVIVFEKGYYDNLS